MEDLFLAHLIGNDEDELVALLAGHEREPEPGIAGGGLDERAARLQASVVFRRLDHGKRDAILDGTARILALQLQEEFTRPGVEVVDPNERSVADQLEDVLIRVRHVSQSVGRWSCKRFNRPRRASLLSRRERHRIDDGEFRVGMSTVLVKNGEDWNGEKLRPRPRPPAREKPLGSGRGRLQASRPPTKNQSVCVREHGFPQTRAYRRGSPDQIEQRMLIVP